MECRDLEYVLLRQEPELLEALDRHAEICAACREQLKTWNELSASARHLRRNWESPDLWPRIHQALAAESQAARAGWAWAPRLWLSGRVVAATLALVLISVAGAWVLLRNSQPPEIVTRQASEGEARLLTEQTLRDIESSEAAYIRSIERLSGLVEPKVQQAASPLLISYREKLMLIDAAIAECRAHIDRNRFNAHLRQELLSIYREKQSTLQDLLKEDRQ